MALALIPNTLTAAEVLNRTLAEVGLTPVADPYVNADDNLVQLQYLLNAAGEELSLMHEWEHLQSEHQITTSDQDSGDYPLPEDFNYIINQTGWERAENVPLFGPLSPQDWTYLLGRDLVNYTIYASFRLKQGQFSLFPQPPPNNLDINFEYMSSSWVYDPDSQAFKVEVSKGTDVVNFHRNLIVRYLKLKWYEAKGFDTTSAQADFNQMFAFLTGLDKGAEVLNVGGARRGFPYLDTYLNTPDTNYGHT